MITIDFPKCQYRYFPETSYCDTVFEQGIVPAAPQDSQPYKQTAKKFGYEDSEAGRLMMCREHELFHTWLMVKVGFLYSPVLWSVINKFKAGVSKEELDKEEAIVLDFQAYLNNMEAGNDLLHFVKKYNLDLKLLKKEGLNLRNKLLNHI